MKVEQILESAKEKALIIHTLKHVYKVDYYERKYCIVRLSGNHANILSRGKREYAVWHLNRLNDMETLL